jgi:hypothetical protein
MARDGRLVAATRSWMATITSEFELGAAETLLLQLAGEAWDNSRAARQAVQRDGAYLRSSRGALVPHPGLKQEIDSARSFAALVKQLDLGDDVLDPDQLGALHKRRR